MGQIGSRPSPAEVSVRIVATLIDEAERRGAVMAALAPWVAAVVTELDPLGERDTSPGWWQSIPPWITPDSLDRLRRGADQLAEVEVRSTQIVADLRATLAARPALARATSPAQAFWALDALVGPRAVLLDDMARAERVLRPRVAPTTSARLRRALRAAAVVEARAADERSRLVVLLDYERPGPGHIQHCGEDHTPTG